MEASKTAISTAAILRVQHTLDLGSLQQQRRFDRAVQSAESGLVRLIDDQIAAVQSSTDPTIVYLCRLDDASWTCPEAQQVQALARQYSILPLCFTVNSNRALLQGTSGKLAS